MQFNGVFSKKSEEIGIAMALFVFINAATSVVKYSLDDMGEIFSMILSTSGLVISCLVSILLLTWGSYIPYREKRANKEDLPLVVQLFFSTFFVYYLLSFGTSKLWQVIGLGTASYSALPSSIEGKLIYIICYAIVPAIAEELLFRGTVLRLLMPGGEWFAVWVSSLLFSLSHWDLSRVVPVFLVSVVFSYVYLETGDIVTTIFMHFVNNAVGIVTVWLEQDVGTKSSYAFVITIMIAGALCIAPTILSLKKYKRKNTIPEPVISEEHKNFLLGPEMLIMFCLYVIMIFQTMGIF